MLRIGIIGCGKIAEVRHAPEYAENPHCRLCGFVDGMHERARAMAGQYGGSAYSSVDALLESDIDAVSICAANPAHAALTIAALSAGKHVLCEKPMAIALADCEAMVAAAETAGRLLMVGHNQRFAKAHVEARRRIAAGEIGRPLAFHTRFGHPGPEGWTGDANSWFIHRGQAAFGAIGDLGVHKLDLIHFLLGEPIEEVSARVETLDKRYPDGAPVDVDDNALCLLRTRSGAVGTLHASWTFYGREDNATRVYGTDGAIRCYDDPDHSLIIERRDGTAQRLAVDRLATNADQTAGKRVSTGVIDAFVDAVRTGKPSVADGYEALRAMRVLFAALRSANEGRTVRIEQR